MIYIDSAVFNVFSNINREGHACLVMTILRVRLVSHCRMSPKTASIFFYFRLITFQCLLLLSSKSHLQYNMFSCTLLVNSKN